MATPSFFTNKIILLTGPTSGIGKALLLQLAKNKNTFILVGRNEQLLIEAKQEVELLGSSVIYYVVDLALTAELTKVITAIQARFEKVDVLINNAGVSQRANAMDALFEVDRYIMELNYFSIIQLTKGIYSLLQKSYEPRIIVISSLSGKFGFFKRSAYSASKHALHGFFESMQLEVMATPLKITMVCPGRIHTSISLKALTQDGTAHNQFDQGQQNGIPVEICAQKIISAAEKGKFEIIIAKNEKWLWFIKKISTFLFIKIASKIKE